MSNLLPRDKQIAVIHALAEGCSMRSTARLMGVNRGTIDKLLKRVGAGCQALMNDTMRNLPCKQLQLDELWAFVGKKQRRVQSTDDDTVGSTWTYVAIDADTKLVPSFLVGKRSDANTRIFIEDVASRLVGRIQITTDGLRMYIAAIGTAFGSNGVDYAQVVKSYASESDKDDDSLYRRSAVSGVEKLPIFGQPEVAHVSTNCSERMNLSIRMSARRYGRLTNAFSKKLDQHVASTALTLAHYNFVKQHGTLRTSPAMAAGICPTLWDTGDLLEAALDGVRP